jgi:hypothetical protein
MGVNFAEIYAPDPFASGGTADAYKRRLLAAQLLQKKASEDDKVYSNAHGGMKLATALLGGMMEGWEENKAKRGQAEGYDALLKMYTGGGLGGSSVSALSSSPSSPSRGSPAGAPSLAGGGASRAMSMPGDSTVMASAIEKSAKNLGISPIDLATVISYETGGKMSPSIWGGAGGRHMGLIQFGPTERQMYGANPNQTFSEQMGAVERYLSDRGLKPGMGLLDLYSTINAGRPGRYGASDANNGGAPGTVADKVNNQMAGHRARAEALFGTLSDVPQADASEAAVSGGAEGFAVPTPGQDPTIMPVADAPSAASLADGLMAFNSEQPVQVASADKGTMPINNQALSADRASVLANHDRAVADALAKGDKARADQLSAMRPDIARGGAAPEPAPQPVTIAESPEAVHRAERAMNPEAFAPQTPGASIELPPMSPGGTAAPSGSGASFDPETTGSVAPPPPPMPPQRPPETYTPRAPRVPPQAMAQALMASGGQQIDPNSNNAGAQQFAAAGMGRQGATFPDSTRQLAPAAANPRQSAPAPAGMYGGPGQAPAPPAQVAASAPSQYAQAGPAAQQQAPQLPQQQQVAQVTAQVAQAGGMTPQQLNEARRTLNNPHVPESVKSSLLQYIQKRFAPPTWKYENVPGYGLVAVNERDPNQTRDVRRVPESPTVVAEGGTAIDRSGKVIYQGGQKQTDDLREYDTYVKQERAANRQPEDFTPWMRKNKTAGAANNTVTVGGGSDEQIFKQMTESATSARAAVTGLNALREAKKAVDAGIISGAGADLNLGLAKIATFFGADPTRVTNTETFRSVIAPQVAALMKATVGSTQISNADREFAERAAGGSISLDSTSIKRLLGIMERASVISIADHQDRLNTVYPDEGGKFARERAVLGLPGNAPVRVRSPAEAERLPSGTSIILPDGSVGRVP